MIRNLKIMGLALVAVLAMSAMTASAASAQGKLTSDGPVTLRGKHTAGTTNALTAFGASTVCNSATYTGHKVVTTPHGFIASGATETTITPHYGSCTAFGLPATVDMNGCDYEFTIEGTDVSAANTYDVRASVICSGGQHIVVTVFSSASNHISGNSFCKTTITENKAGYTGLHATDLKNGHLRISGTVEGIEAHKTGGGFFCPEETTKNAKLDQNIEVEGRNEAGATTAISLSH
jgi:hypothetical protein